MTTKIIDEKYINLWVINGRLYDLADYMDKHPGGSYALGFNANKECGEFIRSMHSDHYRIMNKLHQYQIDLDDIVQIDKLHPDIIQMIKTGKIKRKRKCTSSNACNIL